MDKEILKAYIKSQIQYWKEQAIKTKYSWDYDYARGRVDALENFLEYMEDLK